MVKNRRIATQEPQIYFEKIIENWGEEALMSQFIPPDKELWKLENYKEFIAVRKELLAQAINGLLACE